jgi:hypothetical protein
MLLPSVEPSRGFTFASRLRLLALVFGIFAFGRKELARSFENPPRDFRAIIHLLVVWSYWFHPTTNRLSKRSLVEPPIIPTNVLPAWVALVTTKTLGFPGVLTVIVLPAMTTV